MVAWSLGCKSWVHSSSGSTLGKYRQDLLGVLSLSALGVLLMLLDHLVLTMHLVLYETIHHRLLRGLALFRPTLCCLRVL